MCIDFSEGDKLLKVKEINSWRPCLSFLLKIYEINDSFEVILIPDISIDHSANSSPPNSINHGHPFIM